MEDRPTEWVRGRSAMDAAPRKAATRLSATREEGLVSTRHRACSSKVEATPPPGAQAAANPIRTTLRRQPLSRRTSTIQPP